ncbi:MAG: hypothetical protein HC907_02175 [Richelia sp. SM1_7_0]|nr:hypothetical protein [Richelia sp. SM1_7_0]
MNELPQQNNNPKQNPCHICDSQEFIWGRSVDSQLLKDISDKKTDLFMVDNQLLFGNYFTSVKNFITFIQWKRFFSKKSAF